MTTRPLNASTSSWQPLQPAPSPVGMGTKVRNGETRYQARPTGITRTFGSLGLSVYR